MRQSCGSVVVGDISYHVWLWHSAVFVESGRKQGFMLPLIS